MSDLISRQAAMEEISKQQTYKMFEGEDTLYLDANDVGSVLASLSSAQPEIIRCRECTKCQYDTLFDQHWCNGREVREDFYCGYAERRTDEPDK